MADIITEATARDLIAAAEGKKVFRQLIEAEKQHKLPLVAEVKPDNKSDMDKRLTRYGFAPFFAANITGNFRWGPSPAR